MYNKIVSMCTREDLSPLAGSKLVLWHGTGSIVSRSCYDQARQFDRATLRKRCLSNEGFVAHCLVLGLKTVVCLDAVHVV